MGRLIQVLPDIPMRRMPLHVVRVFARQLPMRARLFVDFLVDQTGEAIAMKRFRLQR